MKTGTRLEAPEGGWGILICIGMAMPFVCIIWLKFQDFQGVMR